MNMRAENVENFVLEKSVSMFTPKRDPPRKAACPADGQHENRNEE